MWKTFQDFLWPHSNLQTKEMWAPLQYIVVLQPQESFPVVSMNLLPLSTAWVPFTFDSLVYRSFSWNFIWQHPAFYKLAECRHIWKKCLWLNLLERHYILLQQNQTYRGTCTSFHQRWRPLWKHVLWTLENLQHVFWGNQRKLWMHLLTLVWVLFSWRSKIKDSMWSWRYHSENQFFVFCWCALSDWTCFSLRLIPI